MPITKYNLYNFNDKSYHYVVEAYNKHTPSHHHCHTIPLPVFIPIPFHSIPSHPIPNPISILVMMRRSNSSSTVIILGWSVGFIRNRNSIHRDTFRVNIHPSRVGAVESVSLPVINAFFAGLPGMVKVSLDLNLDLGQIGSQLWHPKKLCIIKYISSSRISLIISFDFDFHFVQFIQLDPRATALDPLPSALVPQSSVLKLWLSSGHIVADCV